MSLESSRHLRRAFVAFNGVSREFTAGWDAAIAFCINVTDDNMSKVEAIEEMHQARSREEDIKHGKG